MRRLTLGRLSDRKKTSTGQIPGLVDFRVSVTPQERLLVELECGAEVRKELRAGVEELFLSRFSLRCDAAFVERGAVARSLEGQVKPLRFVNQRTGD
jgi:hypothetical protein